MPEASRSKNLNPGGGGLDATRQEFVAQWQGRIGEEAANVALTSARAIGTAGFLVPVWGVLFVVGHGSPLLLVLASVLFVADAVLLAIGIAKQNRLHALLSQRFGTKVWVLNSPSLRERQFRAWCSRHGVNPASGTPLASVI